VFQINIVARLNTNIWPAQALWVGYATVCGSSSWIVILKLIAKLSPHACFILSKCLHEFVRSVIFPMSECKRMLFAKRKYQITKWKNTKIQCQSAGGIPSQI